MWQLDQNCAQSQSKRLSVKLRVTLVSWVLLGTIKQTRADIKFVTAKNQSLKSTALNDILTISFYLGI